MQIAAVNEDACHASTPTYKSHATADMTNCQHHSHQPQQQSRKTRQTDDNCMNMLSFQFRIVVMPHRLPISLLLPPSAFLTSLLLLKLLAVTAPVCEAVGYSYTRFSGPVTGPEQKIIVHDGLGGGGDGGTRVDFIAKPAYEFAYGVEDAQARLLQNRQETRDGDAVRGSYSVVDPDGNLRVVKYTADHINGFKAEVTTNGLHTAVHEQNPVSYPSVAAQPTPAPSWYFPYVLQQQVQHPDPQANRDYEDDTNDGKGTYESGNKGNGNYEVTDDYEENDNSEESQGKQKETNAESDENYDNEDEHEDYDNNEHSAEASKEAGSYEDHSEEYY